MNFHAIYVYIYHYLHLYYTYTSVMSMSCVQFFLHSSDGGQLLNYFSPFLLHSTERETEVKGALHDTTKAF